ncbi:hypothetical protein [Haloarchaeobius sp. DFWS5]
MSPTTNEDERDTQPGLDRRTVLRTALTGTALAATAGVGSA